MLNTDVRWEINTVLTELKMLFFGDSFFFQTPLSSHQASTSSFSSPLEKMAESRMREFIQSFPLTYLLFSSLDPHSPPTGAKLTLLGADSMRITD